MNDSWNNALYEDQCFRKAESYIENATRFGKEDLEKVSVNAIRRSLVVSLSCTRESNRIDSTFKGIPELSSRDIVVESESVFESAAQKMLESEEERSETSQEILQAVLSSAYGNFTNTWSVRTHPARLFYTYVCPGCHGAGKVACDTCDGHGKVQCRTCSGSGSISCPSCHSSGQSSCTSCGGRGRWQESTTVRDSYGNGHRVTADVSCRGCNGHGRVTCSRCYGQCRVSCGDCNSSGRVRCSKCAGAGTIICGQCDGATCLTTLTEIVTTATPDYSAHYPDGTPTYVSTVCDKIGLPNLSSISNDIFLQDSPGVDHFGTKVSYRISIPFCKLVLRLRSKEYTLIFFGEVPAIHSADGILEDLMEADLKALECYNTSSVQWRPGFRNEAGRLLAVINESEIIQSAFAIAKDGKSVAEIANGVQHFISDKFIERLLVTTDKAVSTAANWTRIKALTFLLLTVFPVCLLLTVGMFFDSPQALDSFHPDHVPANLQEKLLWVSGAYAFIVSMWASISGRVWLRRFPNRDILEYAKQRGLLPGFWFVTCLISLACGISYGLLRSNPTKVDPFGRVYIQADWLGHKPRVSIPLRSFSGERPRPPESLADAQEWFYGLCHGKFAAQPEEINNTITKLATDKSKLADLGLAIGCLSRDFHADLPALAQLRSETERLFRVEVKKQTARNDLLKNKLLGQWVRAFALE